MADQTIKACIDVILPPDQLMAAARAAVGENSENAPDTSTVPGAGPLPPSYLALLTGKKWHNGRVLRVRFLDGDKSVQARVEPYAHAWSEQANITFMFGDDPEAEIRISFQYEGSWSRVGADALAAPKDRPTMNFGWLGPDSPEEEFRRVVTHEFGHALGCIHEHSSPAAGIPWNKPAVYAFYQGPPNYWSAADVDLNLFRRYDQSITQFSQFDRQSIMLYPIPKALTLGGFEVEPNTELSAMDKAFIAAAYPKP
jgi:hypothetical protein